MLDDEFKIATVNRYWRLAKEEIYNEILGHYFIIISHENVNC